MTLITAKWSLDNYHQMIETGILDNRSVELLNGEIIQMSPEGAAHSFYCRSTAKSGIPEYWVMNLQIAELVVCRNLTADGYQSETHLTSGMISPLAFPDISIELCRLFR